MPKTLATKKVRKIGAIRDRSTSRPRKAVKTVGLSTATSAVTPRAGLGNRRWMKMIYAQLDSLNPPSLGLCGHKLFRLNSIYDPDFSGSGHQASTHDQMALLFEDYVVTKCDYKVKIYNSAVVPVLVGVYCTDVGVTSTNPTDIVEQGQCQWTIMTPPGGSQDYVEFVGTVDLPSLMGKSYENYIDSDTYNTNFGANPGDAGFLDIFYAAANGVDDPAAFSCWTELTYTVCCKGSNLIPQS